MQVGSAAKSFLDELIYLRRELHKIPEPSFCEYRTSQFVLNYLKALAPDKIEIMANTGVKAVFYARSPKKTLAFRADMDALTMNEENDCEYRSQNSGCMHSCGHDGHMAMALCLAKYVSQNKATIQHNIVFVFQPAEEAIGGAQKMVEAGVLNNPHVDEIYGTHIWPEVPKGKIGINEGAIMSRMCDLNIRIKGSAAHGSSPHLGTDAMVAAATLISMIQTIISRSINPFEQAIITIGRINGGTARNIICSEALLEGTVRTFNDEVYQGIMKRINGIMQGIEESFGVKCENFQTMSYPPVINPHSLAQKVAHVVGHENVFVQKPVMQSEDFSFFQQKTPGMFIMLGSGDSEHQMPLHASNFSFDETILMYGLEAYIRIIEHEN